MLLGFCPPRADQANEVWTLLLVLAEEGHTPPQTLCVWAATTVRSTFVQCPGWSNQRLTSQLLQYSQAVIAMVAVVLCVVVPEGPQLLCCPGVPYPGVALGLEVQGRHRSDGTHIRALQRQLGPPCKKVLPFERCWLHESIWAPLATVAPLAEHDQANGSRTEANP